ncbi:antibiotic biosynthesis monooxygenase family protein [Micromonospora mangrovi]
MTTFRLAPGRTGADFLAANEDIDDYLRRQPGFRWRRITQADDGTITDIVAWDSAADARRSASGIMTEMADSPVHATIDHATVDFRIAPVLHHLT